MNLEKYPCMYGVTFSAFHSVTHARTIHYQCIQAVRRVDSWNSSYQTRICSRYFLLTERIRQMDARAKLSFGISRLARLPDLGTSDAWYGIYRCLNLRNQPLPTHETQCLSFWLHWKPWITVVKSLWVTISTTVSPVCWIWEDTCF